uniref:Uncharacterized protein n=1 Tax=Melicertus latisulcatus pemonivirus TaxID=2984278 RepID=A0A9C7EYK9_9VIRU|nr:MAG: hypothetical protein [Melicertus latisulcatus pemonivirus]
MAKTRKGTAKTLPEAGTSASISSSPKKSPRRPPRVRGKIIGPAKNLRSGGPKLHRWYNVPLKVPPGANVDRNWALVSAMLENTVDMPIGDAKFWNKPFSTLLKHVQLSNTNKAKFQDVLKNGKRRVCPEECTAKKSKSLLHPQRYIYLYRLSPHLSTLSADVRKEMEEMGFKLTDKPHETQEEKDEKQRKKDNPVLLDPSTGRPLSREKMKEVVSVAKGTFNGAVPNWMKDFPGKRNRKPVDESKKLLSATAKPGAFVGTPSREIRKRNETEKKVAQKLNDVLYGTNLRVDGGLSVTGQGDVYYIPVKYRRNDDSLDDSGFEGFESP